MSVTVANNTADFSALAVPSTSSVSLASTGSAVKLIFPRTCGVATLQFITNAGQVAYSGTEGSTLGNDEHDQAAGAIVDWPLPRPSVSTDLPELYVEVDTAPTVLRVSLLPPRAA